jgi:hypothetical protein
VDVGEADAELRGQEEQPVPVQAPKAVPLHQRGQKT